MLGGIVRFFGRGASIGRHVRLFKHQIDHEVSRGRKTNHEREPAHDHERKPRPKMHHDGKYREESASRQFSPWLPRSRTKEHAPHLYIRLLSCLFEAPLILIHRFRPTAELVRVSHATKGPHGRMGGVNTVGLFAATGPAESLMTADLFSD
ncbi:hypothetical protein NITMOv2_2996 [Nitrospira moscoviensis]|uniref:Uncharacterized protein n=1 Tax=Nitrospira moscoviensis TaxID=42253 RepID=A0A0K2GEM9_NITMO|nr:hypothetical protein NITMOv2_2996 [Nitrospira moscoviensis]